MDESAGDRHLLFHPGTHPPADHGAEVVHLEGVEQVVQSGGQVNQVSYTKRHHVAFTFLNGRAVRATVALPQ